ncbi:MAG: twin-arginine translocase TatA/TatE family subunit [Proteobacteria bacterium]|nr:twin-arginine translocase TatA/TatE family subunit [Pseudomonadota bacterium]MBU1717272.1 twin-arginine translocase TatA/TatE family subunit [Pseudomonadota bacterium]
MFGIGLPEMILIIGVALLVVGPEKLPGLAKTLARQMVELKRAANSLKDSLNEEDRPPTNHDDVLPQVVELTAQSPQALPGDQWVHEQTQDPIEIPHQRMPSDLEFSAINVGPVG